MAAINPITDIIAWAKAKTNGDAQIVATIPSLDTEGEARVWEGQVPQDATDPDAGPDDVGNDPRYPCILIDVILCPPLKVKRTGNKTIAWQPLIQVRAIDETADVSDLAFLAGRIALLFDGVRDFAAQGAIIVSGSDCERPLVSPSDASEGVIFRYLGGEFRLFVYQAP